MYPNKIASINFYSFTFAIGMILMSCLSSCIKDTDALVEDSYLPVESVEKSILNGQKMLTNHLVGYNSDQEEYKLTPIPASDEYVYGDLVHFTEDLKIRSWNAEPCFNSTFYNVVGEYIITEKNKIAISISRVDYSGMFDKPTEYRDAYYTVFDIVKDGDNIILTKVKEIY